ncbi:MAG: pyridoxal-phosphate dependent enzyme [Candidatus Korarchaeota archaeon]|nr:pyridoxal-phosphate dependent enzyme [Candidatus Korarchaeota archaeon]
MARVLAMEYRLTCPRCGFTSEPEPRLTRCPRCGEPLIISLVSGEPCRPEGRGVWRYRCMMPSPLRTASPVSLGEGGTPMLRRSLGGVEAWLKLEYLNPLGSFKDRGVSVVATLARLMGYEALVEDSSGNTGLSTAGYAAAAGMRARIYVPRDAPQGKKQLVRLLGASLVEADTRGDAARLAEEELRAGEYHVAHTWNPWFIEGTTTIAYEAAEDASWSVPDAVVAPVASGTLFLGIYYGFERMKMLGMVDAGPPRMIAVQALGTTPIYRELHGEEPQGSSSLVDALRVASPPRLREIAEIIRRTGGDVIIVGDGDVMRSLRELVRGGLVVEPTSAAAHAGLVKALGEGLVERGERILVPLTGTGFKTLDTLLEVVYSHG